jgi:hypothetical protein
MDRLRCLHMEALKSHMGSCRLTRTLDLVAAQLLASCMGILVTDGMTCISPARGDQPGRGDSHARKPAQVDHVRGITQEDFDRKARERAFDSLAALTRGEAPRSPYLGLMYPTLTFGGP